MSEHQGEAAEFAASPLGLELQADYLSGATGVLVASGRKLPTARVKPFRRAA